MQQRLNQSEKQILHAISLNHNGKQILYATRLKPKRQANIYTQLCLEPNEKHIL